MQNKLHTYIKFKYFIKENMKIFSMNFRIFILKSELASSSLTSSLTPTFH